jgi:hypothetical protein
MSVALLVMTDGRRDMIEQTIASFEENVVGGVSLRIINDDSADPAYRDWLREMFPDYFVLGGSKRQGFGGAIRSAWTVLHETRQDVPFEFVFHLEDDFLFNDRVSLNTMMALLYEQPHLAQLALKRQPWGSDLEAGGFMKAAPDWYKQREYDGLRWVETRRNWTTNPALYRADILQVPWPEDPHSEGKYGFRLKEDGLPWKIAGDDVQFGFLGGIEDEPLVHHIGHYRVGTAY